MLIDNINWAEHGPPEPIDLPKFGSDPPSENQDPNELDGEDVVMEESKEKNGDYESSEKKFAKDVQDPSPNKQILRDKFEAKFRASP